MAILRGDARLLFDEAARRPLHGSLLQLGRMDVFLDEAEVRRLAQLHGVALAPGVDVRLSPNPRIRRQGCIDDRSFFRLLGVDGVSSLDVNDYEGAEFLHDLNQPIPPELEGRFDLVHEGGTLHHVFDVPQVLDNIYRLLKPGGRIVHGIVPANNHLDLGFYQFSPTLFADFYSANHWSIERLVFFEYVSWWVAGRLETGPWKIYDYEPDALAGVSYGRAGNRQIGLFVVATKTDESTGDIVPQQNYYQRAWRQSDTTTADDVTLHELEAAASDLGSAAPHPEEAPPRLPIPLLRLWKRAAEPLRRRLPGRLPKPIAIY
ncbi:MAG: class I SAM-dependent methyltransferase [Acidobacteriota bacterium]